MRSHQSTGWFGLEQLEQRRMLSGTLDEGTHALIDEDVGGIRAVDEVSAVVPGRAGPASAGQRVPFHGILEGSFTTTPIPGTPNALIVASGTGQATQLGHFSFDFPLTVNLALQTGSGKYTFTAANSDALSADVIAQSALLPNGLRRVLETATITGGTGRFTGATGSYTSERFLNRATGEVTGSFDGTISSPGASQSLAGVPHGQVDRDGDEDQSRPAEEVLQ